MGPGWCCPFETCNIVDIKMVNNKVQYIYVKFHLLAPVLRWDKQTVAPILTLIFGDVFFCLLHVVSFLDSTPALFNFEGIKSFN